MTKVINFYEQFKKYQSQNKYWKLSQIEGSAKMRIVMEPICGWIDWVEGKPLRTRIDKKPIAHDPAKPVKSFWAMYVWDYERKGLFILEVTQASVLKDLMKLGLDEDYGDLMGYDIKISKEGMGLKTRYSVNPLSKAPIAREIQTALKSSPVRLEALYEGLDPWLDLESYDAEEEEQQEAAVVEEENIAIKIASPLAQLQNALYYYNLDTAYLEDWIDEMLRLAEVKGKPYDSREAFIKKTIMPANLQNLKAAYETYVNRKTA